MTERTMGPAPPSVSPDGGGALLPPVDLTSLAENSEPVGVAIRLVAYTLDALVLVVAIYIVALVVRAAIGPTLTFTDADGVPRIQVDRLHSVINTAVATLVAGIYFAGSWLRFGATPGQRLIGICVDRVDGAGRLGPGQAVGRWLLLGTPLGLVSTLLGPPSAFSVVAVLAIVVWSAVLYVSTARNRRKRGLHDRITGSIVRRRVTPAERPPGQTG